MKTNDKLLKLTREYDIVKRDYRKSQTALKAVETKYDTAKNYARELELELAKERGRSEDLDRTRLANLAYANSCQAWAVGGWCVAAILLGFCLFI